MERGKAFRAPPRLHVVRFGERLPHQLARRIERARDDEVSDRALRVGRAHHYHPFVDIRLAQAALACACSTSTIQFRPNLSATTPNFGEKNVLISGCCTWPPSASALNSRSHS